MNTIILDPTKILNGTQTAFVIPIDKDISNRFDLESDGTPIAFIDQETGNSYPIEEVAPYTVGKSIYVRETWAREGDYEKDSIHSFENMDYSEEYSSREDCRYYGYVYKADTPLAKYPSDYPDDYEGAPSWRSPVTMPKEAARIFLKIVSIKAMQLQDLWDEQYVPLGYGFKENIRKQASYVWFMNWYKQKHGAYSPDTWVWYARTERSNHG